MFGQGAGAAENESLDANATAPSFELDVLPVLTAGGCNAGACHGKSRGQNGFQLSLLGFDAPFDYAAIVNNARGRRLFPSAPEKSLLLRKPTAQLPHGGGERFTSDSPEYKTLRRWIAAGMPRRIADEPRLIRIEVGPPPRPLGLEERQQLSVTAIYSDKSTRDVGRLSHFQSNEPGIAAVDRAGIVSTGKLPGEATIMVRYMACIAPWNVAIPLPESVPESVYAALPRHNFVDQLVWKKLEQLHVVPSPQAPDSTFIRRAFIDIIGRLPTADEAREFLADTAPGKRAVLIDSLLSRPEYADHWANKWADLVRPNPYRVGIKATFNLDAWLRDAFRRNMPYDQFVREVVTAQGSTWRNGAVTLFRDRRSPDELVTITSQLFLGIRLECAKCHHHPFEAWSQDDFYGLAAYFGRIGYKGTGISPPISGGEEMIYTAASGSVSDPRTGSAVEPRPLFGHTRQAEPGEDPRQVLADWILSEDNPYFGRVAANRVWTDLMVRGLVEPVDDLRATNPASNEQLLSALADEFRRQDYDMKQLIRVIATSYVYGLSSMPEERNISDTRNYSRHYRQRLRAEVLLDAISDITQVPESFAAMPPGSRASQLWTHRVENVFLDTFGRPDPNQDPPCERTSDSTVVQALHLMNAPDLHSKVTSDSGLAASLAASPRTVDEIVTELYLLAYSRYPIVDEQRVAATVFEARENNRRQATEDLLWALLNTPEFMFKD